MGTRGFVGFCAEGNETIVYNQFDSYPSGIGLDVLEFARTVNTWEVSDPWEVVKNQAARLIHVSDDVPPTEEDVITLAPWTNLNVSTRSTDDWYCLTRETHGNPGAILACGYADHAPEWPYDSLFCEWGYLLDLDFYKLEVYQGFQTQNHTEGRFGQRHSVALDIHNEGTENYLADLVPVKLFQNEYRPVKLIASYPVTELPTREEFLALEKQEEDE